MLKPISLIWFSTLIGLLIFLQACSNEGNAIASPDTLSTKDSVLINGQLQVFDQQLDLSALLSYLPENDASFSEIQALNPTADFQPYPDNAPLVANKKNYWFTFEIENPGTKPADWVLFVGYEHQVEIFGLRTVKKLGTFVPTNEKAGNFGQGLFLRDEGYSGQILVSLDAQESHRIYIKTNRIINNPMRFDFKIYTTDHWKKIIQPPLRHFGQGFFQGIIWALILYHLIFFVMVRDVTYIYYSVYMICISMLTLGDFGYWQGYLFTNHPYLGWGLFLALQYITGIMTFAFMQKFVELKRLMPKWDARVTKFIWTNFGILILLAILFLLFKDFRIVQFGKLLIAPFALVGVLFCYLLIRSRDTVALYFAIAGVVFSFAVLVNGVLQALYDQGVLLETPYVRYYILQVAAVAHLMTFSVGMGYRRRQMDLEKQRVVELNEMKTRFYTNITHEFRTPLTVIMGMTEQIKGSPQATNLIKRNSKNLLRLINQLLDLSKLESGKLQLQLIHGNIVTYLQYLTESFHSMAEAKNISLTFFSEEATIEMDYDEEKIQHIIYNLLSNAIKFTPKDGKTIFHISQVQQKKQDYLKMALKDSGPGIAPEKLPYIFDRFYQADDSSTRTQEGTGIGLALTKELVVLMDGEISVKSEPNAGTTFSVLLPILRELPLSNKPSAPSRIEVEPVIDATLEIPDESPLISDTSLPILLIIEDNKDVLLYIQQILAANYQVYTAENGAEGVRQAMELIPDIIISDVMMPIMDGYEVCENLKQDERTSHIPIVLLTAKATQDDRIRGLKYGADAYLAKPFDKEELLIRLEKLVELRRQLQSKYAQTLLDDPSPEPRNTMEDEFLQKVRAVVQDHLHDSHFNVPQLADLLHLSHIQLYRKLKALLDQTPSQFIRTTRLQKAAELLKNPELNISEIAYDVGFSDPNYFSRAFQQTFGKSPSDFRN